MIRCMFGFHIYKESEVWADMIRCKICKQTKFTWECIGFGKIIKE